MASDSASTGAFRRIADSLKSSAWIKARDRYGIPESARRNLASIARLAGSAGGGFPTELLPLGSAMWSGFLLTPFAEQQMLGWVLPFWLRGQVSPSSGSFVPHGHQWLYSNSTMRNWTGVGLCGFPYEGMVDPRGLVTPWAFGPSVDLWLLAGDTLACPSELDTVRQRLVDDLPLVETAFEAAGLECTWTTFAAPIDGMPVVLSIAEVSNPGGGEVEADIIVSARPYHNESICAVNDLAWRPGDRCFIADGMPLAYLPEEPDYFLLSDFVHGDVAQQLRDPARERLAPGALEVHEPFGLATGAAAYSRKIPPGGTVSVCFACPITEGVRPPFARMLPEGRGVDIARDRLEDQRGKWAGIAGGGMRVSIPEERYQKAFDVNKTFLLLLFDGSSITPGVSDYHMMWFRDASYLVPALERIGHPEMARAIVATYPDRQTPEGFFRSHNAEWDSNGQAMWTLVNHYRMSFDLDFLKDMYPSLARGARWIDGMRMKDLPADDLRAGLLPAGTSAEHFGTNDCYYWDDLWAVAGLKAAALAAVRLGFTSDARYMEALADEMMGDIRSSWAAVARRLGREVLPISPFRDVDAGSIGILAAVYPLDLVDPAEPAVANTVSELVERCFYKDTHYHGIMHCGINPYMSMHVAQYYLKRRNPYALTIFESLWSMATPTCTFPEAINPLTGGGAYGDGHDGWSACDIWMLMRNMLVTEEGNRLALLALSKREWFSSGEGVSVENAPTHFGNVSYRATAGADTVTFELECSFESPPRAIELNVPFEIVSCSADGETLEVQKGARSVEVGPQTCTAAIVIAR